MKLTLLDMIQNILSDMDSDSVNNIGDTPESLQVASIIKDTYYHIINNRIFPTEMEVTTLNFSGSTVNPTKFTLPESIQQVKWIKYNNKVEGSNKLKYTDITYLEPSEFLSYVLDRDSTNSNTLIVEDGDITLLIKNNINPTYWTSFDDEHIFFDSFNVAIGATMTQSNLMCYVEKEPSWQTIDTFIPDLPSKAFSYLLSEAKSACFIKIKQVASQKDEQVSRLQRNYLYGEKYRTGGGVVYPNYGRK